MDLESLAELDRTESGYNKTSTTFLAYDGRKLEGFVYVNKPSAAVTEPLAPSSRYLGVLVKGARKAGLREDYIKRLESTPTYQPSEETLKIRQSLPSPENLPKITVEELAKHNGKDEANYPTRVSVLGYVIEASPWFGSHRGRDITTRFMMHYHAIPMDDNDDAGCPPYPIVADRDPDEVEYVSRWMDHYLQKTNGKVVGFLKEFDEQQKSGKTSWILPSN